MGILLDAFIRTFGFGEDAPLPVEPAELDAVLTVAFPPLSLRDIELQSVATKRQIMASSIDDYDAAIGFHEAEASRFRFLKTEAQDIDAGLDRYEAEIRGSGGVPIPQAKRRPRKLALAAAD